MNKLFFILAITLIFISCGNNENKTEPMTETGVAVQIDTPVVEVIYFHGKQRCLTCMAIEKVASETVSEKYPGGNVKFTVIDMDTSEGEPIADKYKIARSSLIIVNHKTDGSEEVENLTEKAFANARSNPGIFSTMMCDVIDLMLQ